METFVKQVNLVGDQFKPLDQLSGLILHTATDNRWPIEIFIFDLTCSMFFLTCGFFWIKTKDMSTKRLAWVLSVLTSMTCATLSLGHVHKLYLNNWDCGALIYKDDRLGRFTVTFFIAFLILDLLLGMNYYKEHIHPLSGWFHHFFYLAVLFWSLHSHFTVGFCLFLPLELPTFILALGSIYPEYRTDLGFGATFFITRLAYHSLLLQLLLEIKEPQVVVWPIAAFALVLHVYWFYGWAKSYTRKLKKAKSERDAERSNKMS